MDKDQRQALIKYGLGLHIKHSSLVQEYNSISKQINELRSKKISITAEKDKIAKTMGETFEKMKY
jgi:hypothetical protein